MDDYFHTVTGLISKIYSLQKQTSKKRGHTKPLYSKEELTEYILKQENFEEVMNNRKKSGYKTDLVPSIDRLDDYKGYSLNNIRLTFWKDNRQKMYSDVKNGINTKNTKAIIGIHKNSGEIIEFYSIMEASRQLSVNYSNLTHCCKGRRKTVGGYMWRYKE